MIKIKDLERMLARVYTYSIASRQQIVYEESVWSLRLSEFKKTLIILDQMLDFKIEIFEEAKLKFKSERLR